jgi:hypothetical protein
MSCFYCSLAWLHSPILLPTAENNNNNSSNNNNNGNKNNTSKTTKSSDKYTKIDEVEAGNREKVVPSEPGDVGRIQGPTEKDLREIQGPNNREEEARGVDAAAECYVADFEGSPEADKLKEALFYVSQCYT